jgi:hypothetical protein
VSSWGKWCSLYCFGTCVVRNICSERIRWSYVKMARHTDVKFKYTCALF